MIDKKIGQKIREIRKAWGFSQMELAERIGISFQQIQKYEKGSTRISIMRLQQIAKALGTPMNRFLNEGDAIPRVSNSKVDYTSDSKDLEDFKPLTKEEVTLLKLYRKIKNRKIRQGIIKQLRGAVELETPE